MLNIYFGDMPEAVYNTSVYFNYTYEDEWLTSDFAKEVIKKIDKSDVKGPHAVESPVLGVISPEKLSGGTKTLLLMANDPEKVFNASTCGDNCAPSSLTYFVIKRMMSMEAGFPIMYGCSLMSSAISDRSQNSTN